jgi:hypothetical protein
MVFLFTQKHIELSEFWCVARAKTQIFEETRSGGSFETLTSAKATALKHFLPLQRLQ